MFVAAMAVCLVASLAQDRWWAAPTAPSNRPLCEGLYRVVRVVDGDALIVREHPTEATRDETAEPVRVRLLGIDCWETTESGMDAKSRRAELSAFTKRFVAGRTVRLQFDKRRVDRDGQYLAYVFVDDVLLNEALVEAGLARVSTHPGDSLSVARRLRMAEQEARDQMRGIWSTE